jgi:hypothetical protein
MDKEIMASGDLAYELNKSQVAPLLMDVVDVCQN